MADAAAIFAKACANLVATGARGLSHGDKRIDFVSVVETRRGMALANEVAAGPPVDEILCVEPVTL